MAKKKKKTKSRRTTRPDFLVQKSDLTAFPDYHRWTSNMPEWLDEICQLIRSKSIDQARKRLIEDKIQEELANIKDKGIKFYVMYTIAVLFEEVNLYDRALQCYTDLRDNFDIPGMRELSLLYIRVGVLNTKSGQCFQAIDNFSKAKELDPDNIYTWNNLAGAIMKIGRLEEAMDMLRDALTVNPQYREGYSNLLLDYNYLPDAKSSEIFEESKRWAQIQVPTTLAFTGHDNSPNPHRKLRIGYISPDFRNHSVTFYFESLLDGHDRSKFEIYGYGSIEKPDKTTERLIDKFDFYQDIYKVSDEKVANFIMSDSIDILVDLAGHTGKNRLHVLGFKPAPIQVSYLGYPNTTGMTQVDYRLTDDIADTPDRQKYYTEKLVFLPNGFLCYNPGEIMITIKELPMLHSDYVTFGCFNNINKLSPVITKAWVDILNTVPNSRLLLKFNEAIDPKVREYYYNLFAEHGLKNPKKRLIISKWLVQAEHFELYNNVDIALDTYPYNGTTTTCQALLMGVPVITLAGSRHSSRVGLDILSRIEMQFFAAQSPEEYVKKAVALAANPEALTKIRETMRPRLAVSPLCNYGLITNDIENAYRKMWHRWCQYIDHRITDQKLKAGSL